MAHRSRPHVTIPAGAAPPSNPSPSAHDQSLSPINLWADRRNPVYTVHTPSSPSLLSSSHPGPRISLDVPGRPPSRAASAYEYETSRLSFPEPQLHRSSSQRTPYRSTSTNFTHRTSRSESVLTPDGLLTPTQYSISGESSRPPSFIENTPEVCSSTTYPSHINQTSRSSRSVGTCLLNSQNSGVSARRFAFISEPLLIWSQ